MEEAGLAAFQAINSPPVSPSSTIPAFRGDGWDGHAAPAAAASPLTPGAVARLKGQLEARIDEERRGRSVTPTRTNSPSALRFAQEFQERINRSKSPSPIHSQSPRPRASSPLKKDSRITDALGWRQPELEVSGPAAAAAKFGASPRKRTPQRAGGLVPLSVTPMVAARFELGRSGSRSPLPSVDDAAQRRRAERMAASMPSTSEALREIEAAMRGIEAAGKSPRAAAAAAAQLRTYDNSFWEPDTRAGQEAHEKLKDTEPAAAVERKARPSAAKALFPIGGSGELAGDVGHIVPRPSAVAAPGQATEPATPEKNPAIEGEEEEAFPQTPSSLKSAVWGTKLWPAQSPPTPSDGVAIPAAIPFPATDADLPPTMQHKEATAVKEEGGQKTASGKNTTGKPTVNISATCAGAQPAAAAAPSAPVAATPNAAAAAAANQAEEQDSKTGGARFSAWAVVLCIVVMAELALGVWAVSAAMSSAQLRSQEGVKESPPWWWGFPPQWQFESPPFWGRGPPPQHGFWADSNSMTNAELDNLVEGENHQHGLLHSDVWERAGQQFEKLSQRLRHSIGSVEDAATDASPDHNNVAAMAIIPIPAAKGAPRLWGLIAQLQGALNRALPLPAARPGQPEPAQPQQETALHPVAPQKSHITAGASSSVVGTVVSFFGALAAEMLGLYLLTRLTLHLMAGSRKGHRHSTAARHSWQPAVSQLWQRQPWA